MIDFYDDEQVDLYISVEKMLGTTWLKFVDKLRPLEKDLDRGLVVAARFMGFPESPIIDSKYERLPIKYIDRGDDVTVAYVKRFGFRLVVIPLEEDDFFITRYVEVKEEEEMGPWKKEMLTSLRAENWSQVAARIVHSDKYKNIERQAEDAAEWFFFDRFLLSETGVYTNLTREEVVQGLLAFIDFSITGKVDDRWTRF